MPLILLPPALIHPGHPWSTLFLRKGNKGRPLPSGSYDQGVTGRYPDGNSDCTYFIASSVPCKSKVFLFLIKKKGYAPRVMGTSSLFFNRKSSLEFPVIEREKVPVTWWALTFGGYQFNHVFTRYVPIQPRLYLHKLNADVLCARKWEWWECGRS